MRKDSFSIIYKNVSVPHQSRQDLEQHSVDTASTSDAVNFITYVQTLKRKIKQFEKNVDVSTVTRLGIFLFFFLFLLFGVLIFSHLFVPCSCSVMDNVCLKSNDSSSLHHGFT